MVSKILFHVIDNMFMIANLLIFALSIALATYKSELKTPGEQSKFAILASVSAVIYFLFACALGYKFYLHNSLLGLAIGVLIGSISIILFGMTVANKLTIEIAQGLHWSVFSLISIYILSLGSVFDEDYKKTTSSVNKLIGELNVISGNVSELTHNVDTITKQIATTSKHTSLFASGAKKLQELSSGIINSQIKNYITKKT